MKESLFNIEELTLLENAIVILKQHNKDIDSIINNYSKCIIELEKIIGDIK